MSSTLNQCAAIPVADSKPDFYLVVHPLDDVPEKKLGADHLPPLVMTPSVRVSLFILRGYLILMMLMLLWHVVSLAGQVKH